MSWIFGTYKKNEDIVSNNKKVNLPEKPIYTYQNKKYSIAVGGFRKNVYFSTEINSKNNWIVCGKGISSDNNSFRFNKSEDWEKLFFNKSDLTKLNGHFVSIQFNEKGIKFCNDILGLRDLFFIENNQEIMFSTRLD
ncbi:MAG: hypothetical protein K8S23_15320 [Candidatus Cloacimonetes bacterium]|nr:hypothetical protein [Candidatus Cloacimonadota bacterium]